MWAAHTAGEGDGPWRDLALCAWVWTPEETWPLFQPLPYRGDRGLWKLDEHDQRDIRKQLAALGVEA